MKQRKFFFGRWPYLDLWLDCWLLQVRTEMLNKSFMDFTVHWIRLDVKVCGGRWGFAFKLYSPDRESLIVYTHQLAAAWKRDCVEIEQLREEVRRLRGEQAITAELIRENGSGRQS